VATVVVEEDLRFARNSDFALSFTIRVCSCGGGFAFGFGPGFLRCLDGVGFEDGAAMFDPPGDGGRESGDDFAVAPMVMILFFAEIFLCRISLLSKVYILV
jgi:hypothetical protein